MKPYFMGVVLTVILLLAVFAALNSRQLYSAWVIRRETKRLIQHAEFAPDDFHNPTGARDNFDGRLSENFWRFSIINGGGKVSNGSAWHAASYATTDMLAIYHFPDAAFESESADPLAVPAAGRYNNVTLIGGGGYQPTHSENVVLEFFMQTSDSFYGTAGVIFQPVGTLQQDGKFSKPFDMFGISVVGEESSVMGHNGPICYLALDWNPAKVEPLHVDSHTWHKYQIDLRWISKTEWLGIVYVDDAKLCSISLPPFGPVEVHVWSDNALVVHIPRLHWWQIGDTMDLQFQNGGDKQFFVDAIKIFPETR